MEQFLPYIMNGVGGAILGPIVSKMLGGKGGTGLVAGLVGGLAGGYGMGEFAGGGVAQFLGSEGIMAHVGGLLNGGIGGGVLGGILGLLTKSRD